MSSTQLSTTSLLSLISILASSSLALPQVPSRPVSASALPSASVATSAKANSIRSSSSIVVSQLSRPSSLPVSSIRAASSLSQSVQAKSSAAASLVRPFASSSGRPTVSLAKSSLGQSVSASATLSRPAAFVSSVSSSSLSSASAVPSQTSSLPSTWFACPPRGSYSYCLGDIGTTPILVLCDNGQAARPVDCRATTLGTNARCYYASGVPTSGDAMCKTAPADAPPLIVPTDYNGTTFIYGTDGNLAPPAKPVSATDGIVVVDPLLVNPSPSQGSSSSSSSSSSDAAPALEEPSRPDSGAAGGSMGTTAPAYHYYESGRPVPTGGGSYSEGGDGGNATATTLGSTWAPQPTQSTVSGVQGSGFSAGADAGASKGAASKLHSSSGILSVVVAGVLAAAALL